MLVTLFFCKGNVITIIVEYYCLFSFVSTNQSCMPWHQLGLGLLLKDLEGKNVGSWWHVQFIYIHIYMPCLQEGELGSAINYNYLH